MTTVLTLNRQVTVHIGDGPPHAEAVERQLHLPSFADETVELISAPMTTVPTFRSAVFWGLVVLSGLVIALPILWWLVRFALSLWGVDVHVHEHDFAGLIHGLGN